MTFSNLLSNSGDQLKSADANRFLYVNTTDNTAVLDNLDVDNITVNSSFQLDAPSFNAQSITVNSSFEAINVNALNSITTSGDITAVGELSTNSLLGIKDRTEPPTPIEFDSFYIDSADGKFKRKRTTGLVRELEPVILQRVTHQIGRATFSRTSFPNDDTIPQITEGTQVFASPAFTPLSSDSTLLVEVYVYLAESVNVIDGMSCGLFVSTSTDALTVQSNSVSGAGNIHSLTVCINHEIPASDTSSRVFSLRGSNCDIVGYAWSNFNLGLKYGGTVQSFMRITEIREL